MLPPPLPAKILELTDTTYTHSYIEVAVAFKSHDARRFTDCKGRDESAMPGAGTVEPPPATALRIPVARLMAPSTR